MSYRIVYGPMPDPPGKETNSWCRVLTAVFLLLFVLGVRMVWPDGRELLRNLLLPGEPGVTEVALVDLVEDLRSGTAVGESFTAFCQQVIHGEVD